MPRARQPAGPRPPTRAELQAATERRLRDLVAPELRVLFCGINPGLYSAATGHHFARPGNRFWPTLHRAGFTERLLSPHEERQLLARGYGVTNLVARATASADQLERDELIAGRQRLVRKIRRFAPQIVAVLGVGAYRMAFEQPKAGLGEQAQRIGTTTLWVLPSPSGLNAHYQIGELARLFGQLRQAAGGDTPDRSARG